MRYDARTGQTWLNVEAFEDVDGDHDPCAMRPFNGEDLDHIRDAILEIQDLTEVTSMPGLESVYHQIALRLRAHN